MYDIDLKNLSPSKMFILKNTFKVALQYHFNIFLLELNFKLEIELKMFTFENLEKIYQKHLATLLLPI